MQSLLKARKEMSSSMGGVSFGIQNVEVGLEGSSESEFLKNVTKYHSQVYSISKESKTSCCCHELLCIKRNSFTFSEIFITFSLMLQHSTRRENSSASFHSRDMKKREWGLISSNLFSIHPLSSTNSESGLRGCSLSREAQTSFFFFPQMQ